MEAGSLGNGHPAILHLESVTTAGIILELLVIALTNTLDFLTHTIPYFSLKVYGLSGCPRPGPEGGGPDNKTKK